MPSSYTSSLRLEEQFTGENINVWGIKLNGAIAKTDYAIAGWLSLPVTANVVLTSFNGIADQASVAMIRFTGAGGFSVTIPSVSKTYDLHNDCTGIVIVTTGSGDTVQLDPDDIVRVNCDGTNVTQLGFGGLGLKAYIASVAFSASGSLPAVAGNAGKYVFTDGATSYWKTIVLTDLSDWAATRIEIEDLAASFAINLS